MPKLKHIVIAQTIIILVLLAVIMRAGVYFLDDRAIENLPVAAQEKFLSPRVYAGLLKPGSFTVLNFLPLKQIIAEYIHRNHLNVAVYVENLNSGATFGINEKTGYLPASLTKALVGILVLREVEKGRLTLDTMIPINEDDRVDTAGTLYANPEERFSLRDLLKFMLSESDNTALRTLKRYAGQEDRSLIASYLGYYGGGNIDRLHIGENTERSLVTPKSMYNLFSSLYLSSILSVEHSEFILSALSRSVFDIKKVASIPDDVDVAHKFGARYTGDERYFHDCGIMYVRAKDMRLFYCVMTKDMEEQAAIDTIGWILNSVYSYSLNARVKLDNYRVVAQGANK